LQSSQPKKNSKGSIRRYFYWTFWLGYLLALLVSFWQRHERTLRPPPPLPEGFQSASLRPYKDDKIQPGSISVAFRDVPAAPASDLPPILLLHGSPGDAEVFNLLSNKLQGKRRLIIPDLPGFGHSTAGLPDYSFRAHADYMWELLDKLRVKRVHLVGFSMGGGVVLNMAQIAPERVASITMLSALSVQEMELVGDYHLNHAIHGAQLGLFYFWNIAVPRFGEINEPDAGIPYARNFYDSDQRPLRGILKSYDGPMLILHGEKDPLVPVEAAREVARLVPQSRLNILPSNHFMVFVDPTPLIPPLDNFLSEVEQGRAATRLTASPDRIAASLQPMDLSHWPKPGFVTAFVIFLTLALATFVSEDLACISAGLLVAAGRISFLFASGACFVGIFVGDILLFLAGRSLGRAALERAPVRWFIKPEAIQDASAWLARNGATVIAISRFTPGTRLPTYIASGALHTPFRKFLFYFALAAAAWTPLLVGISAGLGMPLQHLGVISRAPLSLKLLMGGAFLLFFSRIISLVITYKGRRRLIRFWRRVTRWEFWSVYIFYPPVVLYLFYLGLKFRSFTLFTSTNPAIPAGGFIGESKNEILKRLSNLQSHDWLPLYTLISSGSASERISIAESFLARERLSYPVVLKPDAGQRGSGVAVMRTADALRNYLSESTSPVILQEYAPGLEFGVFYYRYPDQPTGRVFSITDKRMPQLKGDGHRTLEHLILDDDRALCMSDFYLRKNAARTESIPAAGESVQLVELGTHCRGAIFLDGSAFITPQLELAVDGIAKNFEGFYFGRFDIRVPSEQDLMLGRNLKVIELNGVTSEATHIYDPKLSILDAYRVLFAQWRIAFEIGEMNRKNGVQPTSALALLRMLREYHSLAQGHFE
jgi:pimeloyl-ACP methyl ester carboxylesterase/membrane protein DedA with SNARE-associated domain